MRPDNISYPVVQRLRLIDFLLDHYGTVRRSAITDFFGVSLPQASRDIQDYIKLAPANIVYDKTAKMYLKGAQFGRVWS